MTTVATPGIDLAKSVFSVHGVDRSGKAVLRSTVRRGQLTELIANLLQCHIEMKVCSGAHEQARRFGQHGDDVRLMTPGSSARTGRPTRTTATTRKRSARR